MADSELFEENNTSIGLGRVERLFDLARHGEAMKGSSKVASDARVFMTTFSDGE